MTICVNPSDRIMGVEGGLPKTYVPVEKWTHLSVGCDYLSSPSDKNGEWRFVNRVTSWGARGRVTGSVGGLSRT
jgi:hypothetical protein